jgi:hypothetical protein
MVAYLVNQILLEALTYQEIISKRADLKASIDRYIIDHHLEDKIDKTV